MKNKTQDTNGWVKHWDVIGTSGKKYKVSQREDGVFGCTCPAWKFQKLEFEKRKACQHILQKQLQLTGQGYSFAVDKHEKQLADEEMRVVRLED